MKNLILSLLTALLFVSCSNNNEIHRKKVISIATRFALTKIESGKAYTDTNGVVTIGDSLVRFVIDPASVFTGIIDTTIKNQQLWITIDSLHDPYLIPLYHLILEQQGDSLNIAHIIRSDARILGVHEGIITAEVPTHDPSSPLYFCSECRDTVLFKLKGESLILLKK
jgi:hypothetical protein